MKRDPRTTAPRSGYRFAADLQAEVRIRGKSHSCTAHDLSRSGVMLIGTVPRPMDGDEIELEVHAPGADLVLRVKGRMARFKRDPAEGDAQLAVSFDVMQPEQQQTLEAMIGRVVQGQAEVSLDELRPGAPPVEVRKVLDRIPLPHRVALATKGKPREREHLRHDSHPLVLEALVRNANLLAHEAREIAKTPTLMPSTLEILAKDQRWERDEDMKVLLITHPRVPIPLAEKLISKLKPVSIRKALERSTLNDMLRTRLLREKTRAASGLPSR